MLVQRTAAEIRIETPAKLNLFFEVFAKRADGYHEIETLMCPIDLYDRLYFREQPSGCLQLECRWKAPLEPCEAQADELPQGSDNLVMRAVALLRSRAGVCQGATLRLIKRIPLAAGLGGGSSDTAAALVAANLGWGLGWSAAQLGQVASEIGSDVPFFLSGGPAICRGRGEQVEPIAERTPFDFVVVRPPEGLATAAVYRACHPAAKPHPSAPIVQAFQMGNGSEVGRLMFNRLQPAAESLSPWICRLRAVFAREDCLGHAMSGSGTSYYGLCRDARQARQIAQRLQTAGVGSVFAVRSCR